MFAVQPLAATYSKDVSLVRWFDVWNMY